MATSIHRYRGSEPTRRERMALFAFLAGLALAILVLVFVPKARALVSTGLQLLQSFILVLALIGIVVAAARLSRRRRQAGLAMKAAAAADPFWSEETLQRQVASLFEPYWRAVVACDMAPVADRLSTYWQARLARGLAQWRAEGVKPVMFQIGLVGAQVIGLEDWLSDERDQVTLLVEARTAYHATDTRRGEVVEGTSCERVEQQLWQFVRGESRWLLNRVDLVGGPHAFAGCHVIRDGA